MARDVAQNSAQRFSSHWGEARSGTIGRSGLARLKPFENPGFSGCTRRYCSDNARREAFRLMFGAHDGSSVGCRDVCGLDTGVGLRR